MPTLNSGNGQLENGSPVAQKPLGLRTAMNKANRALAILGIMGSINAQSQQLPEAAMQKATGAPLGTLKLNQTAAALQEFLKRAPTSPTLISYNESLKDGLTPEEEVAVREGMKKIAIPGNSYEAFAYRVLNALDSKGPSIIETKEQKELRLEMEKQQKMREDGAQKFNKGFLNPENWSSNPKNSGIGVIKKLPKSGGIRIEFKEKDTKALTQDSYVGAGFQIVPGEYRLTIDADGLSMIATFKNGTVVLGQHTCTNGSQDFIVPAGTTVVSFANRNAPIPDTAKKTEIRKVVLSLPEKDKDEKKFIVGPSN